MAHTCHATECPVAVPPAMFMCKRHWFSLPRHLRAWVWRTYRPGQEDDKRPSREYCEAAKACVEHVAAQEGRVADTRLYDIYLAEE
jgi:hypothetical protein